MLEQDCASESGGRILVVRGGAIGDFLLTLPVLAALRRHFPQARLEVLGYPHIAQLALAGGLADAVNSIEARPLAAFFARGGPLEPALADYFGGFDVVLSYLYDPDAIFRDNVARCSKAQFLAGPHRPDEGLGVHATEALLKPLERLAIFDPDPVPRLDPGGTESCPGEDRLALHPGSGSERKNWPEAKWVALVRRLQESAPWKFLLVGGEAESGRLQRLAAAMDPGRVEPAVNLPLSELARRLRACRAFVGHDSGITHLAAALGLPGAVLWGETNEAIWRPRSERMKILRDPHGLAGIAVDRVLEALREWEPDR